MQSNQDAWPKEKSKSGRVGTKAAQSDLTHTHSTSRGHKNQDRQTREGNECGQDMTVKDEQEKSKSRNSKKSQRKAKS